VHRIYFEAQKAAKTGINKYNDVKPKDHIRNIAVIAHVDHGKSTLSDALLHKAGLIHKNRVGDQNTGRSLDSLKDEKERGITIKSAAITLKMDVREKVLNMKEETKPDESAKVPLLPDIYVGNLPKDFSVEKLLEVFETHGIVIEPSCVYYNNRRFYAIIKMEPSQKMVVEKLLALGGTIIGERSLVVQISGSDDMSTLKAKCDANSINMPTINVSEEVRHDLKKVYSGTAHWHALGNVIIQPSNLYHSQKAARQAVAQECLAFLKRQESDHNRIPQAISVNADSSDDSIISSRDKRVPLVINLIDSPGHIDFNAEVTAALRVTDGALVVVDAVEGKAVQTEEVLMQSLKEGVTPVLMINKIDRLIIDKQLSPDEVYDQLQQVIYDVNSFIVSHQLETFPDQQVSFIEGSVCFGSGYFGWSVSIDSFIDRNYEGLSLTDEKRGALRKYLSRRQNFVKNIIKPITRMHRACGVLPTLNVKEKCKDNLTRVKEILSSVGCLEKHFISPHEDTSVLQPRKLLKKAMMAWLPAADTLVDMIAACVPSPQDAQQRRAPLLYSGDVNDECGQGIHDCDALGPVVIYISKMSPVESNNKRLMTFGRIFSGTIHAGDTLRAIRTDGTTTNTKVSHIKIFGIGGHMQSIRSAYAGQLVAFEGIDQALDKAGTLTNSLVGGPIRHMNFSVTPVFQQAIEPKDRRHWTKMVTEMQKIVNADSAARFFKDTETKEYILAGVGELHIEVLVSSLLQNSQIEVNLSQPVISYRETIQIASTDVALAKSENKHNRLWFRASPLADEVVKCLSTSDHTKCMNVKDLSKILAGKSSWASNETSKIWAFGPEMSKNDSDVGNGPSCLLMNSTYGLQIPQDARENIVSAFQQVVTQGILVNCAMRGLRFDLVDAKFHSDASHRRPNSVIPAASKAMRGAFLLANPRLLEPLYNVNITGTGAGSLNGVYSVLGQRSGTIVDTSCTATTEIIKAQVPVRCASGLPDELRLASQGHAHSSCIFGGMQLVPAAEEKFIVLKARERKNLDAKVPLAADYMDKL